ncbi:helix-turn-helix transcriptional regulator [Pedobacter sp. ISL-68]|uniref:AraC family transcriptional regulator n=1 Tax=unclassified Pedobacter TaxID=2628915 RepID=UPI001BE85483|nr:MULTISPECIES: AraC family transcriptional regulator [unclassified Pedobacter]MBT2563128.1 helix-turn-helix transcriptional regulator [Pedobacter sp. ISL-64]MBT2593466.1 helix-turn-helix transcriptional regulator [Pedobacter sp. ISL-68]
MELKLPYINPVNFANTLVNDYDFNIQQGWNSQHLEFPEHIGAGSLQLFMRDDIHFFRGKWKFNEDSTFLSHDPVGQKGLIDFRLSKDGQIHSASIEGDKKFEWEITEVDGFRFFIPGQYLKLEKNQLSDRFEKYCFNRNIVNLQKQLFEIQAGQVSNALLLESKMLEFIYFWMDFLQTNNVEKHFESISDRHFSCLENAKQLLDESPSLSPSIKYISRKVGLNECDLKREFKKAFGLPIKQYVIKQRMEYAQKMLKETDLPVGEISTMLGYANRGHFANLYQRYFGFSPLHDRLTNLH